MLQPKEIVLVSHFRQNARMPLTKISRLTNIPVSTIFDKLRSYEQGLITKHTCLLDFKKLGYDLKAHILFKVPKEKRDAFQKILLSDQFTNSVYRINNGFDFLVEAVFPHLSVFDDYLNKMEDSGALERQEHLVLEDLAKEKFLSHQPGMELLMPKAKNL